MTRDEALKEVLRLEPTFLSEAPQKINGHPSYICPRCGNGSGENGTGIALDVNGKDLDHKHWKCFNGKCGAYSDIVQLWIDSHPGYSSQGEAMKGLYEYFGLSVEDSRQDGAKAPPPPPPPDPNRPSQKDSKAYLAWTAQQITRTDYHLKRGISTDTCKRYGVGYDPGRYLSRDEETGLWDIAPALIIPRGTRGEYSIRLTNRNGEDSKRKSSGNVTDFFNSPALKAAKQPIFVTEGELDALAIIEAGGEAIALGSTSYYTLLLDSLKQSTDGAVGSAAQPLILALDNDESGEGCADNLATELPQYSFFRFPVFEDCKDANEYLTKHGIEAMRAEISRALGIVDEQVKAQLEERKQAYKAESCAGALLPEFVRGITIDTPAIPTGFTELDAVLDGGLYEGLYVLGAISSLGKTALVMQIADQIAQKGQDVCIFSLEMSRAELMARSISRHTILKVMDDTTGTYTQRNAKTARGITTRSRYSGYNRNDLQLIEAAIREYGTYAAHVYIMEGIGNINAAVIGAQLQRHIALMGVKPVAIVDYAQILSPYDTHMTDKQNMDKNILELKRISRDLKLPVVAISSFNRESYNTPVSMAAFKESGAIEYSSDVLLGLQLKGVGGKGDNGKKFDVDEAKAKNPRDVELKVLKNRSGATGKTICYSYYPAFNYFIEVSHG